VSSVDVMRFVSISVASAVTGRNAIWSGVRLAGTTGRANFNFAPGVALPVGFLPGRYGRKVIAGSVSSGMLSFRSCS
jgi:hypothetical protein